MKGAGGTNGGIGLFFIGLVMMCGGFYLLLNSIVVNSHFSFGYSLYRMSFFGNAFSLTTGIVMIPFIFGVGLIFYNGRSIIGWLLTVGSIIALIFGVIASVHFTFRAMSAFELIVILVLCAGGLGLFIRSLKAIDRAYPD